MKLMQRYPLLKMKIEPLDVKRIDAVVQLSLRAWAPVFESIAEVIPPALFDEFYPGGWEASQAKAVEDVCRSPETHVWTANEDEKTLGFVAVKFDEDSKLGEIYMVAVDPDHQKRGVALALTNFALDEMKRRGMTMAMVETGADP